MNWTEGNLARHSRNRKNKDEFLRQREHFAKVRSGLLNPKTNLSPPSIALFAQAPFPISHASSPLAPNKTIPPNSSRKRPRDAVSAETSQYFTNINVELPNPATYQKEQAEEDALRRKRQKLLMKRDWAGTDLQKPIQLEFSKPRTSLGNPWGTSRPSRHSSTKQRFRNFLGLKGHNDQAAKNTNNNPMPVSRGEMKVRVGVREKVLGASFSISISPRSRSYRDAAASSKGHVRKDSSAQRQRSSGERGAGHRRGLGPSSDLPTHQPSDDSGQSRFPTSSSPLLYHPVPCRPTLPKLLRPRFADSEATASNVAQVGMRKPETPFSQRADNEVWRTYVAGTPRCSSSNDLLLPQDGSLSEPRVSPGVSQFERPIPAADPEERQCASGSPLAVSLEDSSSGIRDPVMQTPRDLVLPGHVRSGSFIGGTSPGNASFVSSCADLRASDESPSEISSDASPSRDTTAALEVRNPQSLDPNVPSSDHSVTSADDQDYEATPKPTQEANGMSVLALPSSTDPLSEDALNVSRNFSAVRETEVGAERSIDEGQLQNQPQRCPQDPVETGQAIEYCSSSDENDMWRKFVFGESSDGFEKAFEDARRKTAKSLRPSTTPTSSSMGMGDVDLQQSCLGERGSGTGGRSLALSGEEDQSDIKSVADDFDKSPACTTTDVSASHMGTVGNPSPDPLSEEFFQCSDPLARTDQATYGSSSLASTVPVDQAGDSAHRSEVWSSTTRGEDRASDQPARPQPAKNRQRPAATFKFVQPKLFLGRKTSHLDEQRHISLSAPQIRSQGPTSRRQKRRKDGRTAIRKLPDFDDDPIEEFEDSPSRGSKEHPLFGSLEVEADS